MNAMPLHLTKSVATTRTEDVSGSKRYTWLGSRGAGRKPFPDPYLEKMSVYKRGRGHANGRMTYAGSVKKSLPLGWTLMSFRELNWRPKKLFSKIVTLYGGSGFPRTIDGGKRPRPEVTKSREDL